MSAIAIAGASDEVKKKEKTILCTFVTKLTDPCDHFGACTAQRRRIGTQRF
jgi:hypothetical protein